MINTIIANYLVNGKRLVVPGFGAFIHKEGERTVVFVPFLKKDDGVLVDMLSAEYGVDTADAQGIISEYIKQIGQNIESKGQFLIEGLGNLKIDANGTFYLDYQPVGDSSAASAAAETPVGKTVPVQSIAVQPPVNPASQPAVPAVETTVADTSPAVDIQQQSQPAPRSVVGQPIQPVSQPAPEMKPVTPNPQTPGTARTLYDKLAAQANGGPGTVNDVAGNAASTAPTGSTASAAANSARPLQGASQPAVEPMRPVGSVPVTPLAAERTTTSAAPTVKRPAQQAPQAVQTPRPAQPASPQEQPVRPAQPVQTGQPVRPVQSGQNVQPVQGRPAQPVPPRPEQPASVPSGQPMQARPGQPIPRPRPGQPAGNRRPPQPRAPRPATKTAKADKFMIIAILAAIIALAAIVYGVVSADKGPVFNPIELPERNTTPVTDSLPGAEEPQS